MTLYRAAALHTPADPFAMGPAALAGGADYAIVVDPQGIITATGDFAAIAADHPREEVVALRRGVLLPGFVDTHVHYPQLRAIGGLGMPLLEWLERCALPEELRLADVGYAADIAEQFLGLLAASGTTSALVFGAHFATAMEVFFAAAERSGLRLTAGQVLSDRLLPAGLLTDASAARTEGAALRDRWHGRGHLRYAVTPRFALSASEAILDVCAELSAGADNVWFTSHLNENPDEVSAVRGLFVAADHYLDAYHRHGLVGPRSVFAHDVHPTTAELALLAARGASVAHCPTSNAALGSGLFPMRRHVEAGVRVGLGSDVGAGAGYWIPKEALQAYFGQQLLGAEGQPLTAVHLLYLCTRAGATALGLAERVGDFEVGREFDAVWLDPAPTGSLARVLPHAADEIDALAKVFTLATPADVGCVWVAGAPVHGEPG